ncbi:MAG: hypothetical protein JO108_14200 [Acidobacteriaceae bacterium]|nr:hypothetical protein [Acidobacteriaceae bacterium]
MKIFVFFMLASTFVVAESGSQSSERLSTFFKQNIGLNDSEIGSIEKGEPVAKIVESPKASQMFLFGAISINAQPDDYVRFATNLQNLKSLPSYLALHSFSTPPALSDLSGFDMDADEVADLKNCEPTDCDMQLPAENIEKFRSRINWSGDDPGAQVNHLAKEMVLETLLKYQRLGDSALATYVDKDVPFPASQQFRSLLAYSKVLPDRIPSLDSYLLNYPKGSLPDSSTIFYWEKINFGLRPTLRVNQEVAAHLVGNYGPVDVIAIKQLYANHYFQTALDLFFCIPRAPRGFYLIVIKESEQDGLTGFKGRLIRKSASDRAQSALGKYLAKVKKDLEG